MAFLLLLSPPLSAQFPTVDSRHYEQLLFNGQQQIGPGRRWHVEFTSQSNHRNAQIAGSVQVQGGSGNDIRVLVTKGQSVVYDSGQRRSVVLSVDCSDPGRYGLIFDNSFSLLSAKVVYGKISLVHSGVDFEQNAADQRNAAARHEQAAGIVRRLYEALKANEQFWGTSQLGAPPSIRLINDSRINAAASWADNAIHVYRGLFEFADRTGQADDVLAAVLGHELGHIFYRHPDYGSGPGIKGFFDELTGVTALDRVQEREADVLGTRVACQAGFDPSGVILVMARFAAQDRSASSFMKNHPAGIERLRYLEGEVAECQSRRGQMRTSSSDGTDELGLAAGGSGLSQVTSLSSRQSTSGVRSGEKLWRFVQDPSVRWQFKIAESFVFGERVVPDERGTVGEYDTLDAKKLEGTYVGKQRVRMAFKVRDTSPQSFSHKTCQWEFAVELTSVTLERIEGRWEGYSPGWKVNPNTCEISGSRIWEDVAWVAE